MQLGSFVAGPAQCQARKGFTDTAENAFKKEKKTDADRWLASSEVACRWRDSENITDMFSSWSPGDTLNTQDIGIWGLSGLRFVAFGELSRYHLVVFEKMPLSTDVLNDKRHMLNICNMYIQDLFPLECPELIITKLMFYHFPSFSYSHVFHDSLGIFFSSPSTGSTALQSADEFADGFVAWW